MRRFIHRLLNAFRPGAAEDDLAREVSAHLALIEEEHRRRGLTPDEAHRAARRALGSVALAKDLHHDARSFGWIEDLGRDFRHAVRALRRSPGFALIAVLALGLGIGVNTTFFTIVNAICLRGLPIESPDRVMFVSLRDAQGRGGSLSVVEFEELRAVTKALGEIGGYTNTVAAVGDGRQPPTRVLGAFISAGGIELLGDRPILGRTFRADEDRPGAPAVVILGWELWRSRYASDPGIVGQPVTVNGVPSTVVGVMPRGFMFPANADLWRPLASYPVAVRQSRTDRRLAIYARLAAGATADQARAELNAIAAAWVRDGQAQTGARFEAVPINEQLNPTVWQRAWIAFITAGALVLLVACANVANLLLMRASTRGREMAIRTSIGATRSRVVRQLLVESGSLVALAGAAGVVIAWAGLRVLSGIIPPETMPYWMAFTMDARVFASVTAVCLLTVFVCGLPSALHVMKVDLRDTLTDGGAITVARPSRRWITTLLAGEFAVTLLLIALAVMSVRADIQIRRAEFQIDPASLLTMSVALPAESYSSEDARAAFFDQLDGRIGASPVIRAVAYASHLPYGGARDQPLTISGRSLGDTPPVVSVVAASEGYFGVLGVPFMRGRTFGADDGRPGHEVAIVNERFVQMFFNQDDPIGARIRVGGVDRPWLEIVGVATTVRQQVVGRAADPVVFLPFRPAPSPVSVIVVRTATDDAGEATSLLRTEAARIDSNLPLYRIMPFAQAVRNALWNGRLSNVIIRSIAVVALVLALIGLYAVTGHSVERWTKELGIRVALGARAEQIRWLVLKRVLSQLGVGLVLGIVAVPAFDRLFTDPAAPRDGVEMTDPGVLALIVLSIAVIAVVACVVPIRRATTLDPVVTLRS
jgi:predicted permease